jgi:tRNA1Val (adenine37-N6)-methyltransferase
VKPYTTDTFFDGSIRVLQDHSGYRFSIDAVLLAYHAVPRAGDKILDLGTGCGIIPLILAYRHPAITVYGAEVQEELANLAAANAKDNRMDDRIFILRSDMKLLTSRMTSGPVDLVVCNPPYRRPGSGRINPNQQRALARHEIKINLADVIHTARRMLQTSGKFITIYPAARLTDLLFRMRTNGVEPKSVRTIYSSPGKEAKFIIVEGIKDGRPGLKITPSLTVYTEQGDYTDEAKRMFEP